MQTISEEQLGTLKKFIHDEIDTKLRVELSDRKALPNMLETSKMAAEILKAMEGSLMLDKLIDEALHRLGKKYLPIICKTLAAAWEEGEKEREKPQLSRHPHSRNFRFSFPDYQGYMEKQNREMREELRCISIPCNKCQQYFHWTGGDCVCLDCSRKELSELTDEMFAEKQKISKQVMENVALQALYGVGPVFEGEALQTINRMAEISEDDDFDDDAFFGTSD